MTEQNKKPLISIQGVSKTYRTGEVATTALDTVSFDVPEGQFTAIMGASGSGKSTLLHIIGLLLRPSSGEYQLNGTNTAHLPDETLAHLRNETIGFVFQAFYLLPRTTVLENVMLPLRYSKIPSSEHSQRAKEALEKVSLTHRLSYTPDQLSGGEKQRTAIARALVTQPRLLLADEPTGNLDSKSGQQVMDVIDNLHREGLTVLVITHETPTSRYAQRIITLHDGGIKSDTLQQKNHAHYQK